MQEHRLRPEDLAGPDLDHPDLREIGRRLQHRLDRVLDAEREAAVVLARRSATMRDRLLDAEDCAAEVAVTVVGGRELAGLVAAVTVDHLEVETSAGLVFVPLEAILTVTLR